jgi:hypothetical protein
VAHLSIKAEGSLLSPQMQEGTEATEFNTGLIKQKQTKYLNDSGTESAAHFGNGFPGRKLDSDWPD